MLSAGQSWQSLWLASGAVSLIGAVAVALLVNEGTIPAGRASLRTGRTTRSAAGSPRRGLWSVRLRLRDHRDLPGRDRARRAGDPRAGAGDLGRRWPGRGAIGRAVVAHRNDGLAFQRRSLRRALVEAVGVLASVAWPTEIGTFLAAMLVGGTFMGLTALGLVRARTLATGDPRRVLAPMTGAFGLGQIIGPSFAGLVSDQLGSFTVPSVTAVVALLVAALLALR